IVKIVREFKPTIMVTFDETGGYGHPDHLAIHRWATKAFNLAGDASCYPDTGAAFKPSRLFYASIPRSARIKMAEIMKQYGIESVFQRIPADKFGMPDEMITNRINVAQYAELKHQAMSEHKTQLDPKGPFSKMPEEIWKEWRGTENFALVAGAPFPPNADP